MIRCRCRHYSTIAIIAMLLIAIDIISLRHYAFHYADLIIDYCRRH
jgi:hypothetical protein